ncbi:BON domain-containing protein [Candidatus Cyanaurora vandensis]|uniref:BON domain-containing protein n=1 Tax=Candidatus Cyanaurora vandensis TaxID=2714958 RepID=UPI0025802255|nr:BON domain-containing protein [Candidatus Cyanaurora vandensis]
MQRLTMGMGLLLTLSLVACGGNREQAGSATTRTEANGEQRQVAAGEDARELNEAAGRALVQGGQTGENVATAEKRPDYLAPTERTETMTSEQDQTATTNDSAAAREDATSPVRQSQLQSDTRAIEQREAATQGISTADADLASKVRNQLELNLPERALTVQSTAGVVTVQGRVSSQTEASQVVALARGVSGVKEVHSRVKVQ